MKSLKADIRFIPTKDGGRKQPIPMMNFGCPVYFEGVSELSGHAYDCRLLVKEYGRSIVLGDDIQGIRMIFLSPNIISHVRVGTRFALWEGKIIAHGVVTSIHDD
jgi:hypothetical protein